MSTDIDWTKVPRTCRLCQTPGTVIPDFSLWQDRSGKCFTKVDCVACKKKTTLKKFVRIVRRLVLGWKR
jgi:hypothetical protein